jgi:transcriptional regulator with XRE-family HTH domain
VNVSVKLDETYEERYREFLERLRQARREAGISQEEVAERLGVSQSFISRSERGDRRVDIVELQAFAEIYQKSISFFVG